MTQPSRQIGVPAQYAMAAEVLKNPIEQLRRSDMIETVVVAASRQRRTDAHTLNRPDGSAITVVDHRVPPSEDAPELLVLKNAAAVARGDTDIAEGTWLTPSPAQALNNADARDAVTESWKDKFQIRQEQRDGNAVLRTGLRPPQTGALYGVLGHWRSSNAPATVVMPTGTGKTETMLALLALERLPRLLVVVPTNALREQIGDKFLRLGLLKSLGVLADEALYPVVCRLQHKPKSAGEVDEIFERCNVIVTTMAIAGQCDDAVQKRMAEKCAHLFIDEAHHISARTWEAFRGNFSERPIVQFTATPFRNDGKHVDGRIVFNYPLKKAQSEGYFKPIRFLSVDEIDREEADASIADRAIEALKADIKSGYAHIIMARCGDIPRAEKVFALYAERALEFSPVLLHNKVSATEARSAIAQLRNGERRIVVCVDMLGEGFDLPELKIAAIHDPHKSLAITLQFTGRFTRTRSDLGDATVIANIADPGVEEQLRVLYAEDADWNVLLRDLSEGANTKQARRSEFLETFQDVPDEVSLRNIFPKMSAVVYRTGSKRWRPDRVEEGSAASKSMPAQR
jgi:superfamily II DNA or RNA helicase